MNQSIQKTALRTIELEAASVAGLLAFINANFEKAINVIHASKGRLVISGIGKSAIVAQKIVATLNSTCLLYTSPSPRDRTRSRMPSSA